MKVKCEICGKEYSTKGIGTHIWRNHGNGKDFNPNNGYKTGQRDAWNKGKTAVTDDRIAKQGNTLSKRYSKGELKPSGWCSSIYHKTDKHKASSARGGGFKKNAGRGSKTYVNNINGQRFLLRSSFEVKVAQWLNNNNILWYQPKYIDYVLDGKKRKYFPDFYVESKDVYIETKNDYLLSIQMDKMHEIRKLVNNLLILANADIDDLDNKLKFIL